VVLDLWGRIDILPPRDAIALFQDPKASPIVALDTEYDASRPTCRTDMRGLSLATGRPGEGFKGTFFAFGAGGKETVPWAFLRDRVLWPIFNDPERTVVMHPLKVDMQILRARGLTDDIVRSKLECTMSMAHIYDENLPKGLKELGYALLGLNELSSHAQTTKEMKGITKAGVKLAKEMTRKCWEYYRDHRKTSKDAEAKIDPSLPSWQRMVLRLPPKMKKIEVEQKLGERIRAVIEADHQARADAKYAEYGAMDAIITCAVRWFFIDGVREVIPGILPAHVPLLDLETQVCHPIVTEIEERGLKVDVELLTHIRDRMQESLREIEAELRGRWEPALAGVTKDGVQVEWNPDSNDQVAHIVWNVWRLRPPPWALSGGELKPQYIRSQDGLCSTSEDVLTYLIEKQSPHADDLRMLLDYRRLTKVFGTYVVAILDRALIDPEHRIHASFWPVGARTGRWTSDEPNMQNIPRPHTMPTVRIPAGADPEKPPPGIVYEKPDPKIAGSKPTWRVRSLRDVFVAPEGYKLVVVDLSQIENRLVAHESQDSTLLWLYRAWDCADCGASGETNEPLHACPQCGAKEGKRDKAHPTQPAVKGFCLGRDIHAKSAVETGLAAKHGAAEGRQRAKAVNHAYNYGMGANTLARNEGMSVSEAASCLEAMDRCYPGVRGRMHARVKHDVREKGYVEMFDGHVRRFLGPRVLMRSDNFRDHEWEGVIREAVNVLAQGGTGVIVKRAMLAIRRRLRELAKTDPRFRNVYLINQVHDEIVYEAPAEIAQQVFDIVRDELEHAVQLSVPVMAEGATGERWGSCK
jgi:DNA polymerase I-like protein with 3'-5' exonuclease and polymerase domains